MEQQKDSRFIRFLKNIKNGQSKKELIKEQNYILGNVVSALTRFADRVDKDQEKTIKTVNDNSCILRSSIPTEQDIEKIVQERLDLREKEDTFQKQFAQLAAPAQQDVEWTKEFFQTDKYKALDFYLQLFARFQKRNEQAAENAEKFSDSNSAQYHSSNSSNNNSR